MRNRNRRHKIFTGKYKLFVYAKADQMLDAFHHFTDDVALVAAENKQKAFKLFSKYYGNVVIDDVDELIIVPEEVNILTDY